MPELSISTAPVQLPRHALKQMVALVHVIDLLSRSERYRALVAPLLPEVARFDPGHAAVMMGYDFHLTEQGPRLIEVNTNAGGGLLACRAAWPQLGPLPQQLPEKLKGRLLDSFACEFGSFCHKQHCKPQRIVIIDETPEEQFLYPEMMAFRELFQNWGAATNIAEPSRLAADATGVFDEGEPVELIYNRHCDFYLEDPAMAGLRQAYLAGKVCLTPNPFSYGLIADKRRMSLWSDPVIVEQLDLSPNQVELCRQLVPQTQLLSEMNSENVWAKRKQLVFKPATHYGSKGVLLGEKISRKRFTELAPTETLVQQLVTPSLTETPDFGPMKTDFRLFAYRNRVLGVTARLYRGQVTNLRTPGGGFAPVVVT